MVPRPQTVLLFAISFAACAATPVRPGETGLRGLVLRGPVAPGPEVEGRANEEPFRALFHVYEGGDVEVARFESGDDGRFEVALAPRDYEVVPDESAPLFRASRQRRPVAVPDYGFDEVTLRFDTGLR